MKREAAEQFQLLAMQVSGWLNGRLIDLQKECSEEEYVEMKKGFGKAMGYLFIDIMKPIHAQYPDLKPEELGGSYKIDRRIYFDQVDGKFKLPGA